MEYRPSDEGGDTVGHPMPPRVDLAMEDEETERMDNGKRPREGSPLEGPPRFHYRGPGTDDGDSPIRPGAAAPGNGGSPAAPTGPGGRRPGPRRSRGAASTPMMRGAVPVPSAGGGNGDRPTTTRDSAPSKDSQKVMTDNKTASQLFQELPLEEKTEFLLMMKSLLQKIDRTTGNPSTPPSHLNSSGGASGQGRRPHRPALDLPTQDTARNGVDRPTGEEEVHMEGCPDCPGCKTRALLMGQGPAEDISENNGKDPITATHLRAGDTNKRTYFDDDESGPGDYVYDYDSDLDNRLTPSLSASPEKPPFPPRSARNLTPHPEGIRSGHLAVHPGQSPGKGATASHKLATAREEPLGGQGEPPPLQPHPSHCIFSLV